MQTSTSALYASVFTIRACENAIKKHYGEDEMRTPMHMSAGEEGIVAGVCGALDPADPVFGTFRSHALFLAKTKDIQSFFAEVYGKASGCNKGIAGSMHLSYPEKGMALCSAIVASTIPVAVGAAFAAKYRGTGRVVAAFFGDGATDEGVFWESVNAACLMRLPILFICQDNGIAVHTHKQDRQGHDGLQAILQHYHLEMRVSDSTDAKEIHDITAQLLGKMRENERPGLLIAHYYRYLEHVGVNEDFQDNYRPREEYEAWRKRDPVDVLRARLVAEEGGPDAVERLENDILAVIDDALAATRQAPFLDAGLPGVGVFACA